MNDRILPPPPSDLPGGEPPGAGMAGTDVAHDTPLQLVVRDLVRITSAVPAQWYAWTDDAKRVYVRYRWDTLTVALTEQPAAFDDLVSGRRLFEKTGLAGDAFAGQLGDLAMVSATGLRPYCPLAPAGASHATPAGDERSPVGASGGGFHGAGTPRRYAREIAAIAITAGALARRRL